MLEIIFLLLIIIFIFIYYCATQKSINRVSKIVNAKKEETKLIKYLNRHREKAHNQLLNNPDLNINVIDMEDELEIKLMMNIHRARLAKYGKSLINKTYIYKDEDGKLYEIIDNKISFL